MQLYKPLFISPGTPLSRMSFSELPSPKIHIEGNEMKNARLLPHYRSVDSEVTLNKIEYKHKRA